MPKNLIGITQFRARFAWWVFLFILATRLVQANDPRQVGLVVVHGDGTVTSQCLTFQGEEISGYELLEQSQLDLNIDASNSMGATICRLDGEGCNYPQDDCFCQCQSSRNCIYWSYWHLEDGQWQYSSLGASTVLLHGGEVQGWVWSKGRVGNSADKAPPLTRFETICAPPPTDTPTPTETATVLPSPTDTASPTITSTPNPPTLTPHPVNTPHEFDAVGLATTPTATKTPTFIVTTATVTPTLTPMQENQVTPQPTALLAVTASPTPSPTATEPITVTVAATEVAMVLPSPTPPQISPTATRYEILPTPIPIVLAVMTTPPVVATLPPLAIEKRRVSPAESSDSSWLIFGSLASMLLLFMLTLPLMGLMVGGVVWWVGGRKR